MNQTIKKTIAIIGALLPQFIFENYLLTLIALLLIGVGYSFMNSTRYLFRNLFLTELILVTITYFYLIDRVAYLVESLQAVGMPSMLLYLIFICFNAINIVVLTYLGFKLGLWLKSGYSILLRKA